MTSTEREERPAAHELTHLVVIGSSAGGIDALSSVASRLPAGFPAPVVIAQHVQPTRRSHLGEILARRTRLPVVTVGERASLQAGQIYVVPANRDVEIRPGTVSVRKPADGGPTPSVDHLLSSAAEAYGEGVVAVILTGAGSDGSSGAREVKAAGGTVVIQNPETAAYPSMPASLAPSTVDVVAELDAIGPLLEELVTGARLPAPDTEDLTLQSLLDLLHERSGIDFSTYKRPTILRRLQRRVVATESADLREYIGLVQRSRQEYQRLASSFLIKVTEFFRDSELFAHLLDVILPELVERAAAREDRELRIWSAGCATGEEAYSLAILASEAIDGRKDLGVRVFATDLDAEAVAFARRGIYPAAALGNVSDSLRERHFVATDGEYEISKQTRSLTVFGEHDLAQRSPFPRIDLVLCRNVLIYFTAEFQRRALQLFAFSLNDGGYLALGKAETTSPLPEYFALREPRLRVFRRQGVRPAIPPARLRGGGIGLGLHRGSERPQPVGREAGAQRRADSKGAGAERAESLFMRLPMGIVVVNRDYDIQQINPAARRLLGIHGNAEGRDLIQLAASLPSTDLRRNIDRAFAGEPSRLTLSQTDSAHGDQERTLEMRLEPQPPEADRREVRAVLVMIDDVTVPEHEATVAKEEREAVAGEGESMTRRIERLGERNERLLAANDELAIANADLRAANDELMVSNEEAQAVAEEVETLNEELQATNEELETLNEELQATVEELNTTNDDLEARSQEMRRLAATLEDERSRTEEERARLATILESMSDAVVVIDAAGDIILTNPAYERIRTATALYGREGDPLPPQQRPVTRAARGEPFVDQFFSESPEGARFWYEAAARPIASQDGMVLVIRDITERSLREFQEQFLAIASHELRTPLTVLQGYLQMLERQLGQAGDVEGRPQYLVKALAQTRRISELITNFLDVSRLQAGKLTLDRERLDLAALVTSATELVRGLTSQQTLHVTGEGPIPVDADPARMEQVLLNLLTNAIRYAPEADRIDIRYRVENGEAIVEVQDYGSGITTRDQKRLFRRFYQAPAERAGHGLGLGLHIASEIVKLHGGRIGVDSKPGKGSTFWIAVPVVEHETGQAG